MQFEIQDVFECEGGRGLVEFPVGQLLELFPMPFLHELGMERRNEGQHDCHVFDLVDHGVIPFEVLNVSRECLELVIQQFILLDEIIGFHSSPRLLFPVLVLIVNHGDGVPHGL